MSINDKVKVLWKTNCAWRDCPHYPKRKEIKFPHGELEDASSTPLKVGDLVKIKFGSRWYNAEVAESWEPKTKNSNAKKSTVPAKKKVTLAKDKVQSTAVDAPSSNKNWEAKESSVPLNKNASPTREVEPPPVADNPYEKFVAEQNARELQLEAERTAKRARPQAERAEVINQKEGRLPLETDQGAKRAKLNAELPDIAVLRQELEAKTEECQRLRIRLNEREREMSFQENFTMMIAGLQDSLTAIDHKMTSSFIKLEQRLDALEERLVTPSDLFSDPVDCDNTENTPPMLQDLPQTPLNTSDLSTIDASVLRVTLQSGASCSPTVEVPPAAPTVPLPPLSSPVTVGEELLRNCVTPRKVHGVREALRNGKEPHKCALKLLPYFFTKQELANSNTEGTHKKASLDSSRLNSLKTLVFTQFPVTSSEDKDKIWRSIKGKINSKCHASTYATTRSF